MSFIDTLKDKLGGGDSMQLVLAGALVLIIIIALLPLIFGGDDNGNANTPDQYHMWDIDAEKEILVPAEEVPSEISMTPGMPVEVNVDGETHRAVLMPKCPKCKEYYRPGSEECTKCRVNISEYNRERFRND
jgi:hypothetical protein